MVRPGTTDREIWAYAGEHGYLIVSKDSDFQRRCHRPLCGSEPEALPVLPGLQA